MDLKSGLSPTSFEWHDPRLGSTHEATPPWVVQLSKISLDFHGLEGLTISAYIFGYVSLIATLLNISNSFGTYLGHISHIRNENESGIWFQLFLFSEYVMKDRLLGHPAPWSSWGCTSSGRVVQWWLGQDLALEKDQDTTRQQKIGFFPKLSILGTPLALCWRLIAQEIIPKWNHLYEISENICFQEWETFPWHPLASLALHFEPEDLWKSCNRFSPRKGQYTTSGWWHSGNQNLGCCSDLWHTPRSQGGNHHHMMTAMVGISKIWKNVQRESQKNVPQKSSQLSTNAARNVVRAI